MRWQWIVRSAFQVKHLELNSRGSREQLGLATHKQLNVEVDLLRANPHIVPSATVNHGTLEMVLKLIRTVSVL